MDDSWVQIASFATGIEAEMAREQLQPAGLAAIIHGEGSGLFGAGFQGSLPSGVTLSAPIGDAERAHDVLDVAT